MQQQAQEASPTKVEETYLQRFKVLASEFDRSIAYNGYGAHLKKQEFAKVLIDLCFVHAEKLKLGYLLEFALALPNVNLLWTVLAKLSKNQNNYKSPTVQREDMFRVLAAAMQYEVADLLVPENEKTVAEITPELKVYRNLEGDVCFMNYSEMNRFGMKFIGMQSSYNKHFA